MDFPQLRKKLGLLRLRQEAILRISLRRHQTNLTPCFKDGLAPCANITTLAMLLGVNSVLQQRPHGLCKTQIACLARLLSNLYSQRRELLCPVHPRPPRPPHRATHVPLPRRSLVPGLLSFSGSTQPPPVAPAPHSLVTLRHLARLPIHGSLPFRCAR